MTDEKLIDKIRKLLRLAGNNSSAEAAALAMGRAQELAARYKLEIASISLNDPEAEEEKVNSHWANPRVQQPRFSQWRWKLYHVIARANYCYPINLLKVGYSCIGTKSDAELVTYLYEYVIPQIDKLTNSAVKKQFLETGDARIYATNFRLGCIDTIKLRLNEANLKVRAEYAGTQALVVIDKLAIRVKEVFNQGDFTRTTRAKLNSNQQAREHGREAGHGISLNRLIGSEGSQKRLN